MNVLKDADVQNLVKAALKAREFSYSPYSNFAVGAALLASNGEIYTGCNIENAAFSVTNCAERSALFTAVSAGEREFIAIAVAGGEHNKKDMLPVCTPCGVCRQALFEFTGADFPIILVQNQEKYKFSNLQELLPQAFGPKNIE